MLAVAWFVIVAAMLAVYIVLDGFDLGAGVLHLFVTRNDEERRTVLRSIGPVWDGNEVWLLAGGGALFAAFPALYASALSGFYLPLMMLLWLLILRGTAIEFRNHIDNRVWTPFFDALFCGSSALLAFFFGAALGNVVRGVPLDAAGDFFLPLWTDWRPGPDPGVLDWYTVLVGVFVSTALAVHGALWLAAKTEDALRERARLAALRAWYALVPLTILATLASFSVQPRLLENFAARPAGWLFPALALAALAAVPLSLKRDEDGKAFAASAVYLAAMFSSAAFGVYPNLLPSSSASAFPLTVENSAAPAYGLKVALFWFVPGISLALAYTVFMYRHSSGKVHAGDAGH